VQWADFEKLIYGKQKGNRQDACSTYILIIWLKDQNRFRSHWLRLRRASL
jgi:hypothetical protein